MTDDLEEKLDLSAWDAPDPPADLADNVIAQMGGTAVAPSVPGAAPRPRKRRWVVAGVAAACLVATAGTYALVKRGTEPAGPASGEVVAEQARTLSLGGTRVELDPGARVSWKREGSALRVEQRAGAATWRTGGGDRLWIDAGATTASVEASGASLRVEVKMNQADARVLGSAAATAAVVSLVSIVVYDGYVKVGGSQGQPTVIVQPGSTYTITPPAPTPTPAEPPIVGATAPEPQMFDFDPGQTSLAEVRLPAGETATIHAASMPVVVEIDTPANCKLIVGGAEESGTIVELTAGEFQYSAECAGKPSLSGTLTVELDDARRQLAPVMPQVNRIKSDGRKYRISFQDEVPVIEVDGGTGTLHVIKDGIERTFPTNRIEPGQLVPGEYQFWFADADPSSLVLEVDTSSPLLYLADVRWNADQTQITGTALPHAAMSVRALSVPLLTDGRFMLGVAVADVTTLRVQHTYRGIHYYVLRSPKRVAGGSTVSRLDATSIAKVMAAAKTRLMPCGAKSAASGKVNVEVTVNGTGKVTKVVAKTSFDAAVSACVIDVIKTLTFGKSQDGHTFTFPLMFNGTPTPACDAQKFHDKAIDNVNLGQYAAALMQIEEALKCKPGNSSYTSVAFMAACQAHHSAKAKFYYPKLGAKDQKKLAQICIRNNVDYLGGKGCDAEKLKEHGLRFVNEGDHEKAFTAFEDSLECKYDPYLVTLAFMEACAAKLESKAKHYYGQMTPSQRSKFEQVCIRNGIDTEGWDTNAPAPAPGSTASGTKGYLQVFSKPQAKVYIDGADTGLTTPVSGQSLALTPGKHKVTFVIGDDRFTYPVVIKAGATETMTKDLQ